MSAINISNSNSLSASVPIWLSELSCHGNESNLAQCGSRGWGSHDCSHDLDASVTCSNEAQSQLPLAINLTGGVANNEGLAVQYNGIWGRVCATYFDKRNADVVCKDLEYGNTQSIQILNTSVTESQTVWMDQVHCVGSESHLWECPFSGWGHVNRTNCNGVHITCTNRNYDLRLFDSHGNRGLVQVYYRGVWGLVCDSGWSVRNADVVCHQLGFGAAVSMYSGAHSGCLILMDDVHCTGSEIRLVDCQFRGWGVIHARCNESNRVGVECGRGSERARVRLVGNSTQYEGLVQVQYSGHWGYICSNFWGDFDAQVSGRVDDIIITTLLSNRHSSTDYYISIRLCVES